MENNTTKNRILEKIESGDIQMKSKTHFLIKALLFASLFVITIIALLFLISFIVFMLSTNGTFLLSSFGIPGLVPLIFALPWLLIVIVIALLVVLEFLAKDFSFVYRKPLVYSVIGLIVISIFAGGAIAASPLHKKASEITERRHIPVGGAFYKRYERPHFKEGTYAGEIISIENNEILLQTHNGEELSISTTTRTKFPREGEIHVGDLVLVIGKNTEESFEAFGIRSVDNDNIRKVIRNFREKGSKGNTFPPKRPFEDRFQTGSTDE